MRGCDKKQCISGRGLYQSVSPREARRVAEIHGKELAYRIVGTGKASTIFIGQPVREGRLALWAET